MSKTNRKKSHFPKWREEEQNWQIHWWGQRFHQFCQSGSCCADILEHWKRVSSHMWVLSLHHPHMHEQMTKPLRAHKKKKKKKTITLFTPKASLFQQNTNHNHETKQTYDFGRWALVTKATASTMTTKMATSKKKPLISMFLTSAASPSFFSFLLSKFHASLPFFVTVSLPKFFNYPRFFWLPTVMGGISNGW